MEDLSIPSQDLAGCLRYSPDDAPLCAPVEICTGMLRDPRVQWTAHFALEPRSKGERSARMRYGACLLQGLHALESVWYACLVDRGPHDDVARTIPQGGWERYWCTGLLGTVASLWIRDPSVQALLGKGHREGVTLAQGYLPAVVTALYQIGVTSTSTIARVAALREVARIAGTLPDDSPSLEATREQRRARAADVLRDHLHGIGLGRLAIVGAQEGRGGAIGAGVEDINGSDFVASRHAPLPETDSSDDEERLERRELAGAGPVSMGELGADVRPDRATPPPVRRPGPPVEGDDPRGARAAAPGSIVSRGAASKVLHPHPPTPPSNPISHTQPADRTGTRKPLPGSLAPTQKARVPTPNSSPTIGKGEPSPPSLSPPSPGSVSIGGGCPPPSGNRLVDEMRQRMANARKHLLAKKGGA